jgi:hypothetical protein
MKLKLLTLSTHPRKKTNYWQVILTPTVSVFRSSDSDDNHIAVNFEWLFWIATVLIYTNNDKRTVYNLENI